MMQRKSDSGWRFLDDEGTFRLEAPQTTSYLYFPLVNPGGMMSCVTPNLHGDAKMGQNAFLLRPVSVEDLHESRASRQAWVNVDDLPPWSVSGQSALQIARGKEGGPSLMEAGLLWHTLENCHSPSGLTARVTNLVPVGEDSVELMRVTLKNEGDRPLNLTMTAAVPIFGRSADNLRDHRHVTSLLHRIRVLPNGVMVKPTLSFDERGHLHNELMYAVVGAGENGAEPEAVFPIQEEFRGEGGTLDWPETVVKKLPSAYSRGDELEGYEAMGGLRFSPVQLAPGHSVSYVLVLAIFQSPTTAQQLLTKYGPEGRFEYWLEQTRSYWRKRLDSVRVHTGSPRFDGWMRWVSVQPILRHLFGNSFLPYHDYGRGGRGWRDLWQDILGLLLMESGDVGETLLGHFAGVRFDGSNATIIGHEPGSFKADRNNIPRVWMDHGAWPLLTTRMYLDWSGDLDFLLANQQYFKDQNTHRSRKIDHDWAPEQGTQLMTQAGTPYEGSIFEHLLVQNLTPFFNVGEHNCILLEDADWNDALDMAGERGESVAFSGFYAGNLDELASLAALLVEKGQARLDLAVELELLLDSLGTPVDYDDPQAKKSRLNEYLDSCAQSVSGEKISLSIEAVAKDLRRKAAWMREHLQTQEWLACGEDGWFNGYYDNHGRRVEGVFDDGTVQMTLTGQVFQLMAGVAAQDQAEAVVRSVNAHLYDPQLHGVRLNTRFRHRTDALGRAFGFAYGHKENGAMFSHMALMYAYGLFKNGFFEEGNRILQELYAHCQDFPVSRMYPGLPEYLDPRGRGMYPFLTGSASWYLLTLVTQAFGVRGHLGDLRIDPALTPEWFDEAGRASVRVPFAGRLLEITLENPSLGQPDAVQPVRVTLDGEDLACISSEGKILISRDVIQALPADEWQPLTVLLEPK
jgi:cellobiose phosphorylase